MFSILCNKIQTLCRVVIWELQALDKPSPAAQLRLHMVVASGWMTVVASRCKPPHRDKFWKLPETVETCAGDLFGSFGGNLENGLCESCAQRFLNLKPDFNIFHQLYKTSAPNTSFQRLPATYKKAFGRLLGNIQTNVSEWLMRVWGTVGNQFYYSINVSEMSPNSHERSQHKFATICGNTQQLLCVDLWLPRLGSAKIGSEGPWLYGWWWWPRVVRHEKYSGECRINCCIMCWTCFV